jgi:hypothetical protein
MNSLQPRLAKLEEQIMPAAEPIVIDLVFVDAATILETPGFQVTVPYERAYARTPMDRARQPRAVILRR